MEPTSKRRRTQSGRCSQVVSVSPPEAYSFVAPPSQEFEAAGLSTEEVPDDTLAALRLLILQFPAAARVFVFPFALRSQLYSLVHDRTSVDRHLNSLRMQRQVKMLKVPSSVDEYAYMFALDYRDMVQSVKKKQQALNRPPSELIIFDWLIERVAPAFTNTAIHHQDLVQLLATDPRTNAADLVSQAHVSLLLNAGLLIRDVQDSTVYIFSMVGVGPVVKNLLKQRKDLVSALRRKRHPELFVRELEKRRPRSDSLIDSRFLMRDMIGTSTLSLRQTPSGPLLYLTPRQ